MTVKTESARYYFKSNAQPYFYLVIQSDKVITLIRVMTLSRGIPYYERNNYP